MPVALSFNGLLVGALVDTSANLPTGAQQQEDVTMRLRYPLETQSGVSTRTWHPRSAKFASPWLGFISGPRSRNTN